MYLVCQRGLELINYTLLYVCQRVFSLCTFLYVCQRVFSLSLSLIVFGDLNDRTGSENATETNYDCETFNSFAPTDESGLDKSTMRVSKDKEINEFGKYLLNMCAQFNLIILNGTLGDECGKFTCISTSGCSVIDYFIVPRQLLHMSISLHVAERIESKHIPVELFIGIKNERSKQSKNPPKTFKVEKYIWCDNKRDKAFIACIRSDQNKTCFSEAEELIEANVSSSILKFNEGLLTAVECMKKTTYHNGNSDTDRASSTQKRNEYKELPRQKKTQHRRSVLDTLQKSSSDPETFWKTLKSFAPKKTVTN